MTNKNPHDGLDRPTATDVRDPQNEFSTGLPPLFESGEIPLNRALAVIPTAAPRKDYITAAAVVTSQRHPFSNPSTVIADDVIDYCASTDDNSVLARNLNELYEKRPDLIPSTAKNVFAKLNGTSSTKETRSLLDTMRYEIGTSRTGITPSPRDLDGLTDIGILAMFARERGMVESAHIVHIWEQNTKPSKALIEGTTEVYGNRADLVAGTAAVVLPKLNGTSGTKETRSLLDTMQFEISTNRRGHKLNPRDLDGLTDIGMLGILARADGVVESSHILHVWGLHDKPSQALIDDTKDIFRNRVYLIVETAGMVLKKLDGTSSAKPTRELLDTM